MSAEDWLAPIDAGLLERLDHCAICGRKGVHWFHIWEGMTLAVGTALCVHCRAADPQYDALDVLMQQRYGCEAKAVLEEGPDDGAS
jgi:hypothetical protein